MQRRVFRLAAAAALAAVTTSFAGAAAAATATPAGADPVPQLLKSPPEVARGQALFSGTCGAYCHRMPSAPQKAGAPDAPFLFDCDWLHGGSDEQVFHTITHGVPGTRMVAFGGAIPDQDIWRIVAYLKSASQCKTAGAH